MTNGDRSEDCGMNVACESNAAPDHVVGDAVLVLAAISEVNVDVDVDVVEVALVEPRDEADVTELDESRRNMVSVRPRLLNSIKVFALISTSSSLYLFPILSPY